MVGANLDISFVFFVLYGIEYYLFETVDQGVKIYYRVTLSHESTQRVSATEFFLASFGLGSFQFLALTLTLICIAYIILDCSPAPMGKSES